MDTTVSKARAGPYVTNASEVRAIVIKKKKKKCCPILTVSSAWPGLPLWGFRMGLIGEGGTAPP